MSSEIKTKITDLPSSNQMKSDDVFMISRITGEIDKNYTSYQCNYNTLSTQIANEIKDAIGTATGQIQAIGIVTNKSDLSQTGKKLVQENVIYEIAQQSGSGTGDNYVLKNTSSQQTINGPIKFNVSPQSATKSMSESEETTVVNYGMMQDYVAYRNKDTFIYGKSDVDQTIKQTGSSGTIKGYAYKIQGSGAVRIQAFYTTGQWLGVYAQCSTCGGTVDEIMAIAEKTITDQTYADESGGWHLLTVANMVKDVPQVIILPIGDIGNMGGNVIGLFPIKYDSKNLKFTLSKDNNFPKNTTFKIQQF